LRLERARLDPAFVQHASAQLVDVIRRAPPWRAAPSIAGFVGVRHEPDTRALLQAALDEGKALWLPRVLDGGHLGFRRVHTLAELVSGSFGLFEPPLVVDDPPRELATTGVRLVLVPGLAFGSDGARIGFGRGYYDRALAPLAGRDVPVRVGVCFAAFLDAAPIPIDAFDVPMHGVATERGVVECG
jgi:5-formyltetrahydrofolate cyclo-ligase